MIQIFSNTLGIEELEEVNKVFKSRWLGKGNQCTAFEEEFAGYLGTDRPVLLFNNCTSATFTALEALGIGPGDEVIVPAIQFVGVANAVIHCGARPVFADVDRHTMQILPEEIDRLRSPETRAVFLLHYGGHPAPMFGIREAAYRLLILEDAANAVASTWEGKACGTLGDAGVWSFDAMKELVMVDGGALWMQSDHARTYAEKLRYFGFPPKAASGTDSQRKGNGRWWEFQVETGGGRHISNDVLAAIGRVQLKKLPSFIKRRQEVWEQYQGAFAGVPGITRPPNPTPNSTSSYYLYWVQLEKRDELARFLCEHSIYCTFRYYPLHQVLYYGSRQTLPGAEWAAEHTLCLPIHQNLSDQDVGRIIDTVVSFAKRNL